MTSELVYCFSAKILYSKESKNYPNNFQLSTFQLYLKNTLQHRAKRTGPQIALANLGGTVTLEDYNENK